MSGARSLVPRPAKFVLLAAGAGSGVAAVWRYAVHGYEATLGWLWLAAIVLLALSFYRREKDSFSPHVFGKKDLMALGAVVLLCAPFYLFNLYNIPLQINSDEIVVMDLVARNAQVSTNLFGLGGHFDVYALVFAVFGWTAGALGEIDFWHVRLTHALFGVVTVTVSYVFFRLFFARFYALAAAMLLGFNHALLAISRMAMRENSALLVEVLALFFLYAGFKRRSSFYGFLGGIFVGLSFYVYAPARGVVVVWLSWLALLMLSTHRRYLLGGSRQLALSPLLALMVSMAPWFITAWQAPPGTFAYSREQFVIYPEGQTLQQQWNSADSRGEALLRNARNGLLMFNLPLHDHGYIYPNPGHGFVDPVTGVVLWLGAATLIWRTVRRRGEPQDLLALSGFFSLWFLVALFTTKNPNYTRLLILLPFIAWLTVAGLRTLGVVVTGIAGHNGIARRLPAVPSKQVAAAAVTGTGVFIICILNLSILTDFIVAGEADGNDLGGTARYVMARDENPRHAFYLAADAARPYYSWGTPSSWQRWIAIFARSDQTVTVISPIDAADTPFDPPLSILMRGDVWEDTRISFAERFPKFTVHAITPDGSLVAVEVGD